MSTHVFEEAGHVVGIPDRYMSPAVVHALAEQGARVAVAIAEEARNA